VVATLDSFGRALKNLRLSVTDRCNLRCAYCMPEEEYGWLPGAQILSFEELSSLVDRFIAVGVRRVRLTGGEPLLRRDLPTLVSMLAQKPLEDLAITTNGVRLAELAKPLAESGLKRVTVSLDTLKPDRFLALTRRDAHADVLRGIEAARTAGFAGPLKLDMVVLRGTNDDELLPLLAFARDAGAELRFIEYMDVGGATRWRRDDVVSRSEILANLAEALGPISTVARPSPEAPAELFSTPSGQRFGIIASTTAPFCGACDRARVTADGHWFTCLYAKAGVDLKGPLRAGATPAQLEALITGRWARRDDRGAEDRLALHAGRAALASANELRAQPHLEMHTRGG
jgi:GTP 3',8-cyclase